MKICLLGDGYVGKTSIKRRYLGMKFKATYLATIGADFSLKVQEFKNTLIKYLIWDLAGQQRYSDVRSSYYVGTKGIMLVYDVTNRSSFENLDKWIEEFKKTVPEDGIPIILIANKIDLRDEEGVPGITTEEGFKISLKLKEVYKSHVMFIETSAKTGENVDDCFLLLSDVLYETIIKHKLK